MSAIDFKSLVDRLNSVCRAALEAAAYNCLDRGQYEITIEHFLLRLLDQSGGDISLLLKELEIEPEIVQKYFERQVELMKTGNNGRPQFSPLLHDFFSNAWLISSLELHGDRIRSGAFWAAYFLYLSHSNIDHPDPLIGNLTKERVIEILRRVLPFSIETTGEIKTADSNPPASTGNHSYKGESGQSEGAIGQYCEDFTRKAKDGKIDPVFGRDIEIRQIIDILARRRKNNPICVGDPGVGKTAVIEGLALRIVEDDVPESLKNSRILGLDIGALEAGASVKGEFEKRLRNVIDEIKSSPVPILLFIDEAHTLIGSGGNAGTNDAANLLKPALARGELRTIAATTWREYKKYFEKDPALARRFELVKLDEPSVEITIQILRGLKIFYERIHNVMIRDDAIIAAAELSQRYITGRHLPDKAIDLLDTACARIKVNLSSKPGEIEFLERRIQILDRERQGLEQDIDNRIAIDPKRLEHISVQKNEVEKNLEKIRQQYDQELKAAQRVIDLRQSLADERKLGVEGNPQLLSSIAAELEAAEARLAKLVSDEKLIHIEVGPDTIAKIVSDRTGVPLGKMLRDQASEALTFEDELKKRIKGQDGAMANIAQILKGARSGLNDPNQPLGIFLLIGPSGVGKTETAISVADLMFGGEDSMISINMSEFQEKHSLSRLVGSPPGYVGFGEGGVLTEAVRRKPYSVVLLDEVEKASLDVLNLFYQVFDKGALSDGEGREIDFKNTVIFLTSNLGLEEITRLCSSEENLTQDFIASRIRPILSSHFKPALLARMTVVPFLTLSPTILESIVRMKMEKLQNRILNKNKIHLVVSEHAIQAIVNRCTEVETGARNIDFILKAVILPLLSDAILIRSSSTENSSSLNLSLDSDGEFQIEFGE